VRVVPRKKLLMRDNEEVEGSYYKEETRQGVQLVREQLEKQGKFLK
jgi:hypothetical protein